MLVSFPDTTGASRSGEGRKGLVKMGQFMQLLLDIWWSQSDYRLLYISHIIMQISFQRDSWSWAECSHSDHSARTESLVEENNSTR